MIIDLAGKFPDRRSSRAHPHEHADLLGPGVRRASRPEAPCRSSRRCHPSSADLHWRGFSRMYRKGGRYGPYWFAYDDVTKESPWRPIEGAFTRFGDVLPLLRDADDMYVIMAPGDETTIAVRRELRGDGAEGLEARLPALHGRVDQGLRPEHGARHDGGPAALPRREVVPVRARRRVPDRLRAPALPARVQDARREGERVSALSSELDSSASLSALDR